MRNQEAGSGFYLVMAALVAAIPAVVMYNSFARSITNYRAHLGDAAAEVLRHLSRDLDRGAFGQSESGAAVVTLRRPAE